MKNKNLIILIIILVSLIFTITYLAMPVTIKDSKSLNGLGITCFKRCSHICVERNTSILSFAAIKNSCSCNCKDDKQIIFEI